MINEPIKILIADDNDLVRTGLKNILNMPADMTVAGEARDAQEVMDCLKRSDFDALVLDIIMPGRTGLDILPEIKKKYPDLPVLIFSIYPDEPFAKKALQSGASGYVQKGSEPIELIRRVRTVVIENRTHRADMVQ